MFSFFKKSDPQPATPEPVTPTLEPASTPAVAAVADNPLAAAVETPDVPRLDGHGMDVGAFLAPPATPAASSQIGPKDEARTAELTPKIVEAISTVFDPEIPVNIYELGLIYKIEADADNRVKVDMTLTSPACPSAQQLPSEVRYKVKALEGVTDAFVDVVWEPAWTKDLMSEDAKIALGMF
jgi:FeS assembly SUF system protein